MKYKDLKHNIRLSGLNVTEFALIIKVNPKTIIDFIIPLGQITIQRH